MSKATKHGSVPPTRCGRDRAQRLAATLLCLALVSVSSAAGAEESDPCHQVDCGGHGICAPHEGQPTCACDQGYIPDDSGLICIPEGGAPPPPPVEPPPEPAPAPEPAPEPVPEPAPEPSPEPAPAPPPEAAPVQAPATPPSSGWEAPPPASGGTDSWGTAPPTEPAPEPPPAPPAPVEPAMPVEPPPPPAAVENTVAVTFASQRGRRHIAVRSGEERHNCLTPCTLELEPGSVTVGPPAGHWSPDVELTVPESPSVATIVRGDRGRNLRIAGIVLTAVGGAGTVFGLVAGAIPEDAYANYGGAAWAALPSTAALIAGIVLLAIAPESYQLQVEAAAREPQQPQE